MLSRTGVQRRHEGGEHVSTLTFVERTRWPALFGQMVLRVFPGVRHSQGTGGSTSRDLVCVVELRVAEALSVRHRPKSTCRDNSLLGSRESRLESVGGGTPTSRE